MTRIECACNKTNSVSERMSAPPGRRRYFDRRPALRYLEVSDHDPFKDAHGYIWQGRRGLAKLSDNEYSRDGWAYARARSQNSGMLDWITADGRLGRGSRRRRAMEIAIEELEARRELERWGRWRRDACVRFVGIVNSPPRCFAWHSDGVRWNEHMVKNNFIFCRVSTPKTSWVRRQGNTASARL